MGAVQIPFIITITIVIINKQANLAELAGPVAEGLLDVHDGVSLLFLVVQHRAVSAHGQQALLAEKVQRLSLVLCAHVLCSGHSLPDKLK